MLEFILRVGKNFTLVQPPVFYMLVYEAPFLKVCHHTKGVSPWFWKRVAHRENAGTLGWYPSCLSPPRSPLKGDIPNKYPLYKVYMGLIIKCTIPRVPPFSLWVAMTSRFPIIMRDMHHGILQWTLITKSREIPGTPKNGTPSHP